jgi:adenylate kinase family enzyme
MIKMRVTFILGGPGCGKTTQSRLLEQKFKVTHLSVSDILRSERYLRSHINRGELISSDIVFSLLLNKINKLNKDHLLIDGFPRTLENFYIWRFRMRTIPQLIYFDCPEGDLIKRSMHRSREDDKIQTFMKRLDIFYEQTLPVVDLYQRCYPNSLNVINAQKSEEMIFRDLSKLFE